MEISQWPVPGHARYPAVEPGSVENNQTGFDEAIDAAVAPADEVLHGEWLAADGRDRYAGSARAEQVWQAWPAGHTGVMARHASFSYQETARLAQRRVVRGGSVDTFV